MSKHREMNLNADELLSVWEEFANGQSEILRRKLMLQYIGLVKYVLNNLGLAPNSVLTEEDFLQIGMLGLNEAIERFDLARGIKFETYAVPRIRGVILDEVRRVDWLSRTTRKRSQEYMQTADKLRSEYGREVSSDEIRQKLNLSEDDYKSYLMAAAAATSSLTLNDSQPISHDDDEHHTDIVEGVIDEDAENAQTRMEEEERTDFIAGYLEKIPERQKLVMTLYYYQNLTFKEIGLLLHITESRVCQIHGAVIGDLRKKITDF